MEAISKHISYAEATYSQKAIDKKLDNTPNSEQLICMKLVAAKVFEPLREWYGKALTISSFFRSTTVNRAVGGAASSQHVKGQAIDIDAGSEEENEKIFNYIKENLQYDQLINEYDFSWVHVSFKATGNRNQIVIIK